MENISITSNQSQDGADIQISVQDVYFQYETTDDAPPKEVLHGISLDIHKTIAAL